MWLGSAWASRACRSDADGGRGRGRGQRAANQDGSLPAAAAAGRTSRARSRRGPSSWAGDCSCRFAGAPLYSPARVTGHRCLLAQGPAFFSCGFMPDSDPEGSAGHCCAPPPSSKGAPMGHGHCCAPAPPATKGVPAKGASCCAKQPYQALPSSKGTYA